MLQVGHKIKQARESLNYSQDYMAQALDISQAYYSRIENNQANISMNLLEKVGEVLEIEPWTLLSPGEFLYFKKVTNSQVGSGQYHYNAYSEKEKQLYEERIRQLEEEVTFLREMVKGGKNNG